MSNYGIILYGPPASGKDITTRTLAEIDPTFHHFPRLKIGGGGTTGYEIISSVEACALHQRGDILYENTRYGNRYLVDRPRLTDLLRSNLVPVVHIGQIAGVRAVRSTRNIITKKRGPN